MRFWILTPLSIVLLISLAACSSDDSDDEVDGAPTATATAVASPTPEPTATPEPTPTPESTSTPTPESTATPAPNPTPEPTPESEPERSTLTGEPFDGPLDRPIAVRIDNSPSARPHIGLVDADVVYESPTEAGVTRFLALYQTRSPEVVGPSRSARLMDVDVVPMHDAILAYSGASIGVQDRLWQRGLPLLHLEGNADSASWRDDSRFAPHNLMTSIPDLRALSEDLGWNRDAGNTPFTFGELPGGGLPGGGVAIPFVSGFVEFSYNEETDSYDRTVDGTLAVDEVSSEVLSFRNVVVIWAPFFVGDIAPNTRGEISNDVDLCGSGDAWILRHGQRYEVEWQRDEQSMPFRFFDRESGSEIPLAEGTTWINLLPLDLGAEAVDE